MDNARTIYFQNNTNVTVEMVAFVAVTAKRNRFVAEMW